MKYQIYLNKETSDLINAMAEQEKKKPSTFIKSMLESLIQVALKTNEAVNEEINKYGKR